MNDDNWKPPENPDDWSLLDKVRANNAGLGHLVPGTYEWKMAYRARTGKWPETKPPSIEDRLRHAEEAEGRENIRLADEEREQARQDRYKTRLMELARKSHLR